MPEKPKPTNKKRPASKVFDVHRPGQVPASPTSRPVIVGRKSGAQKSQAAVSGVGERERRPLMTKQKIELSPISVKNKSRPENPSPAQINNKHAGTATIPNNNNYATSTVVDESMGPPPVAPQIESELAALTQEPSATGAIITTEAKSVFSQTPDEAESDNANDTLANSAASLLVDPAENQAGSESGTEATLQEEVKESSRSVPNNEYEPNPAQQPVSQGGQEAEAGADLEREAAEAQISADELPKEVISSVPDENSQAASGEAPEDAAAAEQSEPKIKPLFDDSGKIVVSLHHHRKRHTLKAVLLTVLILLLAAVILNLLLDLDLISLNIPHTDWF